MTREVGEGHIGHVLIFSGAVRAQQGEVWGEEAVLQPVTGKGFIEQLTQKCRADNP